MDTAINTYDNIIKFAIANKLAFKLLDNLTLENLQKEVNHQFCGINNIPIFVNPTKYIYNKSINKYVDTLYDINEDNDMPFIYFQTIIELSIEHTNIIIYANSIEAIDVFINYMKDKYTIKTELPNKTNIIYEWQTIGKKDILHILKDGYVESSEFISMNDMDLIGMNEFIDSVEKDIKIFQSNSAILKRFNMSPAFNYLLHGPPGNGKTSFVKAIATKFNLPIYNVKLNKVSDGCINDALCPTIKDGNLVKIVLIEDFDKYLVTTHGMKKISELLTGLDGIYKSDNIIRFFSANCAKDITYVDPALSNRMRRILEFKNPSRLVIKKYLASMFSVEQHIYIDNFIEKLDKCNVTKISMRNLNAYLSRFLMDEIPLKKAVCGISKWNSELNSIKVDDREMYYT